MTARKIDLIQNYSHLVPQELASSTDWNKIFVCENAGASEILDLAVRSEFHHVCQTKHPHFAAELNAAAYLTNEKNDF